MTQLVRALRIAIGETQQSMATNLGLAISTMVRYETSRPPHGEALVRFMKLANAHNLPDIENGLRDALSAELGHDVMRIAAAKTVEVRPGEEEDFQALETMLRLGGKRNQDALAEWKRISEPIKAANRRSEADALAQASLHKEIRRRVSKGQSDDEIAASLAAAWPREWVILQAANMRELDRLSKASRRATK